MATEHLLEEFPPVSTAAWEEAIARDLKGADYDKKLIWRTEEGLRLSRTIAPRISMAWLASMRRPAISLRRGPPRRLAHSRRDRRADAEEAIARRARPWLRARKKSHSANSWSQTHRTLSAASGQSGGNSGAF